MTSIGFHSSKVNFNQYKYRPPTDHLTQAKARKTLGPPETRSDNQPSHNITLKINNFCRPASRCPGVKKFWRQKFRPQNVLASRCIGREDVLDVKPVVSS